MKRRAIPLIVLCGLVFSGCSEVPSLEAASGDQETNILISDVVKRVKCELADSFDDKLIDPHFRWLENWTAKVDLTLQVNDTAGVSPSVSYTRYYRNAFNYAAGSSSLTSTVIAAVPQTFTLTGSANYSEQAQRAETVTFTVSLREIEEWRRKTDQRIRYQYGADAADHFCDPKDRELRGKLGLKEWIDSALYPVTTQELQAGIHPEPSQAAKPPSPPSPKVASQASPFVPIEKAKQEIDAAAKAAAASADNAAKSEAAAAASLSSVQTAMQTNIAPYYSVLTDDLKRIISKNLSALTVIQGYVKKDADDAASANAKAQEEAKIVDAPDPPEQLAQQDVTNAQNAAEAAASAEKDAKAQQDKAASIATGLSSFKPNPPIDALLHSVQFVVTYGGGIAPNWSLLLWKGPGLTIPGASLSGVRTNILNIAFGPTTEQDRLILNQTITNALHP